jgi:dolichyl-phosphate beta-glucosyltransferase
MFSEERVAGQREVSIILPAYNEERRLASTLETLVKFCERECEQWEVIVVDDGSRDRTAEIAAGFQQVHCVRNEVNRGKGYSVRRGMLAARLDRILFTDVDLSTPIRELLPMMESMDEGADVVIATRRLSGGREVERRWSRRLQAAVFRCLVQSLVLRGLHDTQCGFKLFRRAAARTVFSLQKLEGWAFDVEVLYLARQNGLKIAEVEVEWHESADSRLRLTSPFQMVRDLLRIRRLHRHRGERSPHEQHDSLG